MKALAIFGSTARNERSFDSDIDMIGIYDNKQISSISKGSVSLFLYPESILIEKMRAGDLFALHLVKESMPIYGSEILNNIFDHFEYKSNYSEEINTALKVSDEILSIYNKLKEHREANKKLSWCLRTIIISMSAQDKKPVFSKKHLSEYIKLENTEPRKILTLINVKGMPGRLPEKIINTFSFIFKELQKKCNLSNDNYDEKLFFKILEGVNKNNKKIEY